MTTDLCKEVRRIRSLEKAWFKVRDNGQKSRSKKTRNEIKAFSATAHEELRRIQQQLVRRTFRFAPARGHLEQREGKDPRPLVITPIESRIVQRALLDQLIKQPGIQAYTNRPTSFGGVKKTDDEALAAVPGAIHYTVNAICDGRPYFIRSDIAKFFTKIPKAAVLQAISSAVSDDDFLSLVAAAIEVELHNLEAIRTHVDLFPLEDIGVAQGCALSPLLGNILLSDFDITMSSGDCRCVRYIDDFIIIGPTLEAVDASFLQAQAHLSSFGMHAYCPSARPDKARRGHLSDGIEFLGVDIHEGSVKPSSKNCGKLIESVKECLDSGFKRLPSDSQDVKWDYDYSVVNTLASANAIVAGWGNQYFFCNERNVLAQLDDKITLLIRDFFRRYIERIKDMKPLARRRMLGVRSLHDCKLQPIRWSKTKATRKIAAEDMI